MAAGSPGYGGAVLASRGASAPPAGRVSITVTDERATRRILVAGELDAETTFSLTPPIAEFEGDVVIDLGAVRFADSTALRVLLVEHERFDRESRTLRVVNPSSAVQRLLDLLGGDRLIGSDR